MKLKVGMMFVLVQPDRIGVPRRYTEQVCRITKQEEYRYIFEGVFIVDDVEYALLKPFYAEGVIRPLRNENTVAHLHKKGGLLNSHSMFVWKTNGQIYRLITISEDGQFGTAENVFNPTDNTMVFRQNDVKCGIVRIL